MAHRDEELARDRALEIDHRAFFAPFQKGGPGVEPEAGFRPNLPVAFHATLHEQGPDRALEELEMIRGRGLPQAGQGKEEEKGQRATHKKTDHRLRPPFGLGSHILPIDSGPRVRKPVSAFDPRN
jgi:hypothetical protein